MLSILATVTPTPSPIPTAPASSVVPGPSPTSSYVTELFSEIPNGAASSALPFILFLLGILACVVALILLVNSCLGSIPFNRITTAIVAICVITGISLIGTSNSLKNKGVDEDFPRSQVSILKVDGVDKEALYNLDSMKANVQVKYPFLENLKLAATDERLNDLPGDSKVLIKDRADLNGVRFVGTYNDRPISVALTFDGKTGEPFLIIISQIDVNMSDLTDGPETNPDLPKP